MSNEQKIQDAITVNAAENGDALWRNNSGAMFDKTGRLVRFGLGNTSEKINDIWKSPDLIGITSLLIHPGHIGRRFAIFTGVDVKPAGWQYSGSDHERAQRRCLDEFKKYGGIGIFARSVEEYEDEIESFIRR